VIAIVGGLGAAVSWAVSTLASSRSSRLLGAPSVIAWVMVVGFAVILAPAAFSAPVALDSGDLVGLLIVGISNNAGLLLAYAALRIGRVSIVAPIVATEGAVAAAIAVALGEPLRIVTAVVLAAITIGVVLAAAEQRQPDAGRGAPLAAGDGFVDHGRRAALLAIAAALAFAVGLVTAGRLGETIPVAWILLASRTVGTFGIALPLLVTGRLRLSRAALPLVVLSGFLEVAGTGLYIIAAQDGIAAAAVLSSQFAAIAAVAAFFLFGERLQRIQVAGVVTIAAGVTALAIVRP
jgi:drug/metabolite transporter (DMT)-like permease